MAILKIARMGHPVLRRRADEIPDPTAPEIRKLVADMVDTLRDAEGAGLAAPQVYVPLRLVMFHIPAHRATGAPDDGPAELTVLINPIIEPLSEEKQAGWEACLSVPGLMGAVPRFTQIRYRGVGLEGQPIERTASGFHARVVQHECDHLDGVLYPMRMTDLSLLGFAEDMQKAFAEARGAERD
jgi:peptide deformylase